MFLLSVNEAMVVDKLKNNISKYKFTLVSLFNGISTFMGYLMSKPFS